MVNLENDRFAVLGTVHIRARILVQVTIYRTLRIGQDRHHDQCEAYDISCPVPSIPLLCLRLCGNLVNTII